MQLTEQFVEMFRRYGEVVCLSRLKNVYAVADPEILRYISKDNVDNYDKYFPRYKRLEFVLGHGLLTTTGKDWWHRRKLLQPFFTHKAMDEFAKVTIKCSERLIERWKKQAKSREPVLLVRDLLVLVLQTSVAYLFSYQLSYQEASKLVKAYQSAQRSVSKTISLSPYVLSRNQWLARIARSRINRFVKKLVKERRTNPNPPQDFLQLLLDANDESTGEKLAEQAIFDELRTFLGTGHETTGHGLFWTMTLLQQNPEHQQILRQELDEKIGNEFSYPDLERLKFNKMVFQEGLRLYPPIWAFARRAMEADTLGEYEIPKGSLIAVSTYANHRLEKYWPDPDVFNPYRFTEDAIKARNKYTYLPFGVGHHSCIANQLSMVQGEIIQAMLFKHFEFEFLSEDFDYELLFTIRPKYPIYVRLKERE